MSSQKNGAASPAARNNYSAPHTPIASAKRPRASLDKSMLSPAGGSAKSSVVPSTPLIHEDEVLVDDEADVDAEPDAEAVLSPMHKPKPLVVKASDAEAEEQGIFSPMLHLSDHDDPEQAEGDDDDPRNGSGTQGKHDHEGYDDEALDQPEQVDDVLVEDDGSSQGSIDEDEFNPYVFIKSLPPYNVVAPLRPPIALPQKDKDAPPISLVLDLDETLVHCSVEPVDDADLVFPVVFHGMTYQVNVRLRPHLFTFLERIKDKFEVIVFTASQQVYADELLNLIDPDGKYIQHRMFRESCLAVEGNFLKDLNVLGRNLNQAVLVDNSPHAFGYQVDNGIPIESWFEDPDDTELLKLERFLRTLHGSSDVRKIIRKTFQTYKLIEGA